MSAARRAVVLITLCAVIGFAGVVAGVRLTRSPPALAVHVVVDDAPSVPGTPQPITLPATGSVAVATDLDGTLVTQAADTVRPIASIAKVMTALVVLQAHPLAASADGPVLTMTADDVADWQRVVAADGSNLPVTEGEQLSERDLLLALLLPSADNIADTLGRWVSGSDSAFVNLLNAHAAALGMGHTHFADASGLDTGTVSTASDLLVLARAALADPALPGLVSTREATLPDGTTVVNLDGLLESVPGWLGIKTGSTPAAGGCLLFAARRDLGAGPGQGTVTLTGAVLGQPDLASALDAARSAALSTFAGYVPLDLTSLSPHVSGSVTARWDETVHLAVGGSAAPDPTAVRAGQAPTLTVSARHVTAPLGHGAVVATIVGHLGTRPPVRWPVVTASPLGGPSFVWRLLNG